MTVRFSCTQCGTNLSVPDNMAGRQGKCKKCGAPVAAPLPSPTSTPAPLAQAVSTTTTQPGGAAQRPTAEHASKKHLFIFGGIALLLILIIVVLVIPYVSSNPEEKAKKAFETLFTKSMLKIDEVMKKPGGPGSTQYQLIHGPDGNISFNVNKTNGLVSPYVATADFKMEAINNKDDGLLLSEQIPTFTASFAYQEGTWVIQSVKSDVKHDYIMIIAYDKIKNIFGGDYDRQVSDKWLNQALEGVLAATRAKNYVRAAKIYDVIISKTGDTATWQPRKQALLQMKAQEDRKENRDKLKERLDMAQGLASEQKFVEALEVLRNIGQEDRTWLKAAGVSVEQLENTIREDQANATRVKPMAEKMTPPATNLPPEQAKSAINDLLKEAVTLEKAERFADALTKLEDIKQKFEQKHWPEELDKRIRDVKAKKEAMQYFNVK